MRPSRLRDRGGDGAAPFPSPPPPRYPKQVSTTPDLTSLRDHLRNFDRSAHAEQHQEADHTRARILELFPRESWATMRLADYALGQDENPDNYCVWIEHRSDALGSMKGGESAKMVIYHHRAKGWQYDKERYVNEHVAWEAIRGGFLELFAAADRNDFDHIDDIEALRVGMALRTKTAYVYFPESVLPVYSSSHLCFFLSSIGRPPAKTDIKRPVRLNRQLLDALREIPETEGFSNLELMRAVYQWNDPRAADAKNEISFGEEQMAMMLARFRSHMPDFVDFENPGEQFVKDELTYKRKMQQRFKDELGAEKMRSMIGEGRALEALELLTKIPGNLVQYRSWRQSFGTTEESVAAVLSAFLDVAAEEYVGPKTIRPLFEPLKKHGLKPAWDTMSVTLWLLRPSDYFPIKIRYYRALAAELGMKLVKGRAGVHNLPQVLSFGRALRQALEPLSPADWIDVQSFWWVVCPDTYGDQATNMNPSTDDTSDEAETNGPDEETDFALNQILYGPPGTGKTYSTVAAAVEIIDGDTPEEHAATKARFDQLVAQGRIGFVTFHQSYTYEDFVEGIRPVMDEDTDDGSPRYECRDGIFKVLCKAAREVAQVRSGPKIDPHAVQIWKMSLGNTLKAEDAQIYADCIERDFVGIGFRLGLDYANCGDLASIREQMKTEAAGLEFPSAATMLDCLANRMKTNDLVVVTDGNRKFRALGRISGDYQLRSEETYSQTRPVEWLRVFDESQPRERLLKTKAFTQRTLYQLRHADLKLDAMEELLGGGVESGLRPHVLIIDEINRANISKVLGELITLLEPDKREGAENALSVSLPYSQESFSVPPTLHVIGTMNTADKSIALVDVALRRRFEFHELLPDFGCCSGLNDDMRSVLDELNHRIALRKDRDHQIGHAYFMRVRDPGGFNTVFRDSIVPLLQEYFYNDWDGLRFVLGEVDRKDRIIVALAGSEVSWARNRWRWYHDGGDRNLDFLSVLTSNYGKALEDTDVVN